MRATPTTVEGDIEALFRAEYEPMYRLAYTLVASDAWAEEIVQDAFLVVADRWPALTNPGGYLRVTVVNGARKRLRTQASRAATERRIVNERRDDAVATDTYLLDVLDELPERQRVAVVLTYYEGMNSTEVSEVMDCPAPTVRSLVHRALQRLEKELEQ